MSTIAESIKVLFENYSKDPISSIDKLPQSGSDRMYYRIKTAKKSFIATFNKNIKENKTFVSFSKTFKNAGAPVPEIYAVNDEGNIYIQQDLGDISLLSELEKYGYDDRLFELYKKSLKSLAALQINADKELDYNSCITSKEFGQQSILSDLLYF